MAEEKPYISREQRPDVTIDLDKNIRELTLRELWQAIRERPSSRGIDDIKFAPDSTTKNGNILMEWTHPSFLLAQRAQGNVRGST